MKTKLLLLLLLSFVGVLGQTVSEKSIFSVSFQKDTIKVEKDSKDIYINIPLKIKIIDAQDWNEHTLEIEIDPLNTNLPASDYIIYDTKYDFKELSKDKVINILLKKDTINDRDRVIVLKLKTKKGITDVGDKNLGDNKDIVIIVKSHQTKYEGTNDYKILSYVGTNFDMVEGKTKAKNLFFATNIFLPPIKNKNKVGFYFSLYGNRTMSDIDSTGNTRRTYKLKPISDSSHIKYTSQNKMIISRVSDNIGVHLSPLFRIIKSSNHNLNLYYAPSLEFIWRKSSITTEFKNPSELDSLVVNTHIPGIIIMDNISKRVQNEYVFNFGGVGLFLVYETKDFSFRINSSVGYSSYFYPSNFLISNQQMTERKSDVFFSGRAWITENKTGITLQTEIMNTAINPRPFFGVTLSKAFKLDQLSTILAPLTSR
ncbi:hypothetical protein [Moheibacter sediminis]|uniref:Uncharacterized protein n=1 Tax=Moheibacter sediminis TaxID=1434700 RepID=A0A1W1YAW7_9FLAO|nr:hypothetical protein [Moheibacter sediminis]SMC32941.1 hypothetical protein SAMN06296427_101157 [Moheibacter sediminis]